MLNVNLIFNSFIRSEFNYWPLIWMFYSRKSSNLINQTDKSALRLCTENENFTFAELLSHTNSLSLLITNYSLRTKVYESFNGLSPPRLKFSSPSRKTYIIFKTTENKKQLENKIRNHIITFCI